MRKLNDYGGAKLLKDWGLFKSDLSPALSEGEGGVA